MLKLHAHIEVKIWDRWFHFDCVQACTDYLFFALLNGEGTEHLCDSRKESLKPVAEPLEEDIPKNLCIPTKLRYDYDMRAGRKPGRITILSCANLWQLKRAMTDYAEMHYYREWMSPMWLEERLFHTDINGGPIERHDGFQDVRLICWYVDEP